MSLILKPRVLTLAFLATLFVTCCGQSHVDGMSIYGKSTDSFSKDYCNRALLGALHYTGIYGNSDLAAEVVETIKQHHCRAYCERGDLRKSHSCTQAGLCEWTQSCSNGGAKKKCQNGMYCKDICRTTIAFLSEHEYQKVCGHSVAVQSKDINLDRNVTCNLDQMFDNWYEKTVGNMNEIQSILTTKDEVKQRVVQYSDEVMAEQKCVLETYKYERVEACELKEMVSEFCKLPYQGPDVHFTERDLRQARSTPDYVQWWDGTQVPFTSIVLGEAPNAYGAPKNAVFSHSPRLAASVFAPVLLLLVTLAVGLQ